MVEIYYLTGLNANKVSLVINFDLPMYGSSADMETYLHRIGWVGRFRGSGRVLNLTSSDLDRRILKNVESHYKILIEPLDKKEHLG